MATFPGWEQQVLAQIGAPATAKNVKFLDAWQSAEGGTAANNPLNTTQTYPGATNYNTVGVKNYPSAAAGVTATAQTLLNGRYSFIVSALRNGNPDAIFQLGFGMKEISTWGTDAKTVKDNYASAGGNTQIGSTPGTPVGSATGAVTSAVSSTGDFLGRITDPVYILRGFELVAGSALVLLGLWLLVKQVGLAAGVDVPSPVQVASATIPGAPAQKAARAAQARSTSAAQAVQVRESRAAELHTSRVKLNQARATELRTRTRHRRRTKQEQNKELDRAYIRGAADTSPLGG